MFTIGKWLAGAATRPKRGEVNPRSGEAHGREAGGCQVALKGERNPGTAIEGARDRRP